MNNYKWSDRFLEIFRLAEDRYRKGLKTPDTTLTAQEIEWLAEIGHTPREFFDFVEDFCRGGEPDPGTALLLAAQRRAYFLEVQKGQREPELPGSTLPPKPEEVEGIPWLPRLIEKAKRKLRGQMDDNLMYGCGGDRNFFNTYNIHPYDFIEWVKESNGNDAEVVARVVALAKKKVLA